MHRPRSASPAPANCYDICVTPQLRLGAGGPNMVRRFSGNELVCVRGEKTVFESLSFSVSDGDALVLRGPNGSGKSSLLRVMAGLLQAESGALLRDERDVTENLLLHRASLHYVGHQNALKPLLTVIENLAFAASLRSRENRCRNALETFALANLADVPVRLLSAGQRRRLTLARLIASQSPLWLLDEPTTSLDEDAVATLQSVISSHRVDGGIVVLAAHSSMTTESPSELDLRSFAPHDGARYEAAPS